MPFKRILILLGTVVLLHGCVEGADDDAADDDVSDDDVSDDDVSDDDAADDDAADDDAADDDAADDDAADDDAGDDDTSDDDTGDDDTAYPLFDPGLILMDDEIPGDQVTVEPDRLILPSKGHANLLALDSANILVSGHDTGYLRRVTSVTTQGNDIVIDTTQAQLVDAVIHGDVADSLDLLNGGQPAKFTSQLDFAGTTLYDDGDLTVTITQGDILFNPIVDFDIEIDSQLLERLYFHVDGTLTMDMAVEVVASGPAAALDSVLIWDQRRTYVSMFDSMPLVSVVYLELRAGFDVTTQDAISFEAGVSRSITMEAGFEYQNGQTTPIANFPNHGMTPIGPSIQVAAGLQADFWIEPRIQIEYYDVGGPHLRAWDSLTATLPLADPICGWSLVGEFDVEAGADVEVLDTTATIYLPPLFDWSQPVIDAVSSPDWEANCCNGDVLINGDSNFRPGPCPTFTGDIYIGPSPFLTHLDAMASVETLVGNLYMDSCTGLTDLTGLAALTSISGDLLIDASDGFTDLPMPALTEIGGDVTIRSNDQLTALTMPSLTHIGGHFWFHLNDQLTTLTMPNLATVDGEFEAYFNDQLGALTLPGLTDVGGDFDFAQNASLSNTAGLSALHTVGGTVDVHDAGPALQVVSLPALESVPDLHVHNNTALQTLELPAATTLSGGLSVEDNPMLEDVDLGALSSAGDLFMLNNPMLQTLALPALTSVPGYLSLQNSPMLTDVDLGALQSVGNLGIYLNSAQTLDLHSLGTAGGVAVSSSGLSSIDLSALSAVTGNQGSGSASFECDGLSSLSLPNLSTTDWEFSVSGVNLQTLDISTLDIVGGRLWVMGTSLSLLDISDLDSVGPVYVQNNPNLVSCDVCDAFSQPPLSAGCNSIYDNDDTDYPNNCP